jgi:P27 family predicted phage terminase small subunit
VLEGNPGKRSLNSESPKPRPGRVSCPTWLSPEAKREWRRLAPELQRLGLLTPLDRAVFAAYCESYAHWRRAQRVIKEQGHLYVTANARVRQRPEVAIADSSLKAMKGLAAELGLTPSGRSRFSLPQPTTDEDDEFVRLLD